MNEELKIKTETVNFVDYQDVNRFIAKEFGMDAFECYLESANDSIYRLKIEPVSYDELDDYNKSTFTKIVEHQDCTPWQVTMILNHMCYKGLLPAGTYMLNVSW